MGAISDRIADYRAKKIDLEQLIDFLMHFDYQQKPEIEGSHWGETEEPSYFQGGWMEVYGAWAGKKLTDDEYWTIHERLFG